MRPRQAQPAGFTVVELLIVVAIALIIFSIAVIGFRNFAAFQQYNQAVGDVTFVLQQAHTNARAASDDAAHGVKIGTNSITAFVGDTYSGSDPNNVVYNYTLVTFSPALEGGTDEIIFAKLTGLPSATGTVDVVGAQFGATTTLEITDTGVIQ